MTGTEANRGGRLAVLTAVAGTVLIAAGAFWLSFTSLADLARRSGIESGQAWAWPLIVDGIIVVATVAVVALASTRTAWYPWMLLICGAGLSVTANSIHAIVAADADVPAILAAAVAAVPPMVLLAITHLTVTLTRHRPDAGSESSEEEADQTVDLPFDPVAVASLDPALRVPGLAAPAESEPSDPPAFEPGQVSGREVAAVLRAGGWSNKKIARYLDVHPSTVGRWLPRAETGTEAGAEPAPLAAEDLEQEEEPS